ncbi:hypothetical protein [Streptomyces turgidiscabies]|uniref:hypothetical protein n=1 Tax=Streptomyces turgidiscabies TaxID=85558 RepID=UPI0038F625D3
MASEETERSVLATIEAFESAAFRVGRVARRLLAEHPDLPVWEVRPFAATHPRPGSDTAQLELASRTVDDVAAWAQALGTTPNVRFHDSPLTATGAFEFHLAAQTIDGVDVRIMATRSTTEEETAAWRAKTAEANDSAAAEGGEV